MSRPFRDFQCDLNCDLGEGEPHRRTAALMRCVTSASIACGGHAGDLDSMRFAVREASKGNVRIGAHPGLNDPVGFGRDVIALLPQAFVTLLIQQISALEKICKAEGTKLHHVKLHGALYHMTEGEPVLRTAFVSLIREYWPRLTIFALAGGQVIASARAAGLNAWPEGFLDRAYTAEGTLVPRTEPNALLSREEFFQRIKALKEGISPAPCHVRTWCLHSDTPHALEFARIASGIFAGKNS